MEGLNAHIVSCSSREVRGEWLSNVVSRLHSCRQSSSQVFCERAVAGTGALAFPTGHDGCSQTGSLLLVLDGSNSLGLGVLGRNCYVIEVEAVRPTMNLQDGHRSRTY